MNRDSVLIPNEILERYAESKLEWNRVMKRESSIGDLMHARMKLETNAQRLADAALEAWKDTK